MNEEVKKKEEDGTKRLNGKKGKTHSLGRNQVEYQRYTSALMNCYVIQLSHEAGGGGGLIP